MGERPKPETRNPKEIRTPKSEPDTAWRDEAPRQAFEFLASAFFRPSDFGLRISCGLGCQLVRFGRGPPNHLDHAGHAHIPVAHCGAATTPHTGHRQFALDEVLGQLAEEAAVAPVVYCPPRV